MIEVMRTAVNTWECDQMGHLNVRHYFGRVRQGLAVFASELGLGPAALQRRGLKLNVVDQHLRFHGEMRPGTAFTVQAGVLEATPEAIRVVTEIHFVHGEQLAATSVLQLRLLSAEDGAPMQWPAPALERAQALRSELQPLARVRGVSGEPPRTPPSRAEALDKGMVGAYLGTVVAEDLDAHGEMTEAAFMGRISDGIPHFFWAVRGELERQEGVGGAALEYRYIFHHRPRLGDLIEVRSGLMELAGKAFRMCHYFFDPETGGCLASAEAVAVSFDLRARRAMELPAETRAQMQQHVIEGLGL